ncbi:unnamed protein product [Hyaloperonospora brassicae]|uniref:C2H2-type domain-containing protein n=1 Tax=Hyaloperonospora brassicae TaxID=162125 RepID=A0AAV0T185_HYABA|nr:unnamed protein product [Hyaloperonospora brassicae]
MSLEREWQTPLGLSAPPAYKQHRCCYDSNRGVGASGGVLDPILGRSGLDAATGALSEMDMATADHRVLHDGHTGSTKSVAGELAELLPSLPTAPELSPSRAQTTYEQSLAPSTVLSVDSTVSVLVDAAYTELSEPRDPKLKTEKIASHRKVRCKFPDCPNRARVSQYFGNFCNRHVIVAPCGFPGCREKAMDHAAMCLKHLKLGKEALNKVLTTRTQNVPVCRTQGCFKNDQGRGYCRGHENLMMATGRLPVHVSRRRLNSAYTMCSYPECTKHSQRRHLCRTHGNLLVKQAQGLADQPGATESFEDILARMEKDMRQCTWANCTKNSQRDRLCTTHYNEKQTLQRDGGTPMISDVGAAIVSEENGGTGWRDGAEDGHVQAIVQTDYKESSCEVLPYAVESSVGHLKEVQDLIPSRKRRDCDPFLSSASAGVVVGGNGCEQRQASYATTTSTACANTMCNRGSYGSDYCGGCQKMFSLLVVPVHENMAGTSGYPYRIAADSCGQFAGNDSICRAAKWGQEPARGGPSASHFRPSGTGSMPVDQVNLTAQTQRQEWELTEVPATTVAEATQATPTRSGRTKKYYCKIDGCDKQAQRRSFCKRHYRLHASAPTERSEPEPEPSSFATELHHAVFSRPAIACHFRGCSQLARPGASLCPAHAESTPEPEPEPSGFAGRLHHSVFFHPSIACHFLGCSQLARSGTSLCSAHAEATFCWQPGCENLVSRGRFCGFHGFRKQCAYADCTKSSEQDGSGCKDHANAPKCRHEFCDKFVVKSEMCRLHQRSCQDFPCALCRLHALSPSRFAAGIDASVGNGADTM